MMERSSERLVGVVACLWSLAGVACGESTNNKSDAAAGMGAGAGQSTGGSPAGGDMASAGGTPAGGGAASSECVKSDGHAPGSADSGFGVDGVARLGGADDDQTQLTDLLLEDDGSALALTLNGLTCAVFRLTPEGTPDASFGDGGRVDVELTPGGYCFALARDAQGRVLVAGSEGFDAFVARLSENGEPDTTFAEQGRSYFDFGSNGDRLVDFIVRADGSIVAIGLKDANAEEVGNLVAFLGPDGAPLAVPAGSFTELDVGAGRQFLLAMAPGADGHFLLLGYNQTTRSAFWSEVDAEGVPVPSFGDGGLLRSPDESISDLRSLSVTGPRQVVAWGNKSGIVSFDSAGELTEVSSQADMTAVAVATQCDGKLLVGGLSPGTSGALKRLLATGEVDDSFEPQHWTGGQGGSEIRRVIIQPDTKVLIGGIDLGQPVVARYWP